MRDKTKAREARAEAFASSGADAEKENPVYNLLFFAYLKGAEEERSAILSEAGSGVLAKNIRLAQEREALAEKVARYEEALILIESCCPEGRISIIPQKALQHATKLAREALGAAGEEAK